MRISVIIPSFNGARWLEEALRSILDQDGEKEILVVDGGSRDGTLDIIRRYADQLTWWCSEPDGGQTEAINKGLARMTGDVWMYLNCDDLLEPGAFARVREAFADASVEWVGGDAEIFGPDGPMGWIRPECPDSLADYLRPWGRKGRYVFPFSGASFMRRSVYARMGGFDARLNFCMDIEYYLRAVLHHGIKCRHISCVLARWRRHPESKTEGAGIAYGFREEEILLARRYLHTLSELEREIVKRELPFEERQTVARKACYLTASGREKDAVRFLTESALRDPALWTFRPWWGAMRRSFGLG